MKTHGKNVRSGIPQHVYKAEGRCINLGFLFVRIKHAAAAAVAIQPSMMIYSLRCYHCIPKM